MTPRIPTLFRNLWRLAALFIRRHQRRLRWVPVIVLPLIVCGAMAWNWGAARRIPASGGLYFPGRVEIAVPIFRQGDERWKDDLLGPTDETLHQVGCAVASAAMVMASYGIDTDPGRLNAFLAKNEGYTPQGWIHWEKAAEFQPGLYEKAYEDAPSYAQIDWNLLCGNPVIIRVRLPENNHFVVIAGKQGWDYLIQDPGAGASKGLYPLSELVGRIDALRYYRKLSPPTEPPADTATTAAQ